MVTEGGEGKGKETAKRRYCHIQTVRDTLRFKHFINGDSTASTVSSMCSVPPSCTSYIEAASKLHQGVLSRSISHPPNVRIPHSFRERRERVGVHRLGLQATSAALPPPLGSDPAPTRINIGSERAKERTLGRFLVWVVGNVQRGNRVLAVVSSLATPSRLPLRYSTRAIGPPARCPRPSR